MEPENDTHFKKFLLLGFSEEPELWSLIFALFLSMYLTTVSGNLLIVLATISDSLLHTPMYFFLSNLSFVDICFTSTTIPKMVLSIQMQSKGITYEGCISQVYFYILFAGIDNFLLTIMAYDRFVAICHPLHYSAIMNAQLCRLLVLVLFPGLHDSQVLAPASMAYDQHVATCNPLLYMIVMSPGICIWPVAVPFSCNFLVVLFHAILSYCHSNIVSHFYHDDTPLLRLTCSDTPNSCGSWPVLVSCSFLPFWLSLSPTGTSFRAILRRCSAEGRCKAFSTCGSHMLAVTIVLGTLICMYLQPSSYPSLDTDKMGSVFYTVIIPMPNPLIYNLRNKEVKDTPKKAINRN
uniref:Olfactory receptor n=1 Tax=Equus caballus TaxID=9796 RepID=F6XUC7_HORSE